jgi:hypothetical protein
LIPNQSAFEENIMRSCRSIILAELSEFNLPGDSFCEIERTICFGPFQPFAINANELLFIYGNMV